MGYNSSMTLERPDFLDKKYPDMPGSKPVERAVVRSRRDSERQFAPHTRDERIQAYLDRLDTIVKDERGWELLKHKIIKEFSIDTDDHDTIEKIANGLYESEKRLAREQGRGADVERLEQQENTLEQYKGLVAEKHDIQERTLGSWLEYLHQNDAGYPTWFRYFVVRNLQKMGTLDKEKGEYSKRTALTVAPFPELNSEALGFVYRMLTTGIGHQEFPDEPEKRAELEKLVAKKDFVKLYTFAQIETAGALNRESLQGEWVKYPQGSDHHILEQALRGKGTGWCTAEGSAPAHLRGGDFYVYFTRGTGGKYSEPRIAIRMEGDHVAEVRGVNHRQELEPALVDVATEKYHALPGGEKFDKKSADMKRMTMLAKKQENGEPFTKDDLVFLYEINSTIEGFGYDRDPRIKELRNSRNVEEDMLVIFECTKNEIAHEPREITENTKVYVGPWNPQVYQTVKNYPNIQYLYESFPDKKVFTFTLETDPRITTPQQAEATLKEHNIYLSGYGKDNLYKTEFSTETHTYNLVQFTVEQLGFPHGATTDEICAKAQSLGLKLCPAEVGPHLRLAYPGTDWKYIAMKQISGADGFPFVFYLDAVGAALELHGYRALPELRWGAGGRFVFRT